MNITSGAAPAVIAPALMSETKLRQLGHPPSMNTNSKEAASASANCW
jgi:hypothetical protein